MIIVQQFWVIESSHVVDGAVDRKVKIRIQGVCIDRKQRLTRACINLAVEVFDRTIGEVPGCGICSRLQQESFVLFFADARHVDLAGSAKFFHTQNRHDVLYEPPTLSCFPGLHKS
jgi:hypothetical protein